MDCMCVRHLVVPLAQRLCQAPRLAGLHGSGELQPKGTINLFFYRHLPKG